METEEITVPAEAMKKHAFRLMEKMPTSNWEEWLPEGVDDGPTIEQLEDDVEWVETFPWKGLDDEKMWAVQFGGKTTVTRSRQTSRAITSAPPSKCRPAEYEHENFEVGFNLIFIPEADNGLGESYVTIEG